MLTAVLAAVVLWVLYKWYTSVYKTFEKRGIHTLPSSFPYGTSLDHSLARKFPGETIDELYKKAAPHPYFVAFVMRSPVIYLRDPEIIRLVLAKEFSHFRDRQGFRVPKSDILGHHLFNLDGERWRALRVKLSPTFTSGKIKMMFQHFITSSETLEKFLLKESAEPVNVKKLITRFTMDVICSCVFGVEANMLTDPNSKFNDIAFNFLSPKNSFKYKIAFFRAFPFFLRFTRPRVTPQRIQKFFIDLVRDIVEYREKTSYRRNDFIDILLDLKQKGPVTAEFPDGDSRQCEPVEMDIGMITAQCFVFLFAGFETSSSVQSYCLYEMALNPEIQERLRTEITTVIAKHGGVTIQAIQEMEYLDMVISETMRKYPTLSFLTRSCTRDFKTPYGHTFLKGDRITIPTWSLHRDPQYFPEPEKFNPERFSKENKEKIVPFTYLPFGEGPRICIAARFGLLQTKMGLISILKNYRLEPCQETQIPLQFSSDSFLITAPKGPITLKLNKLTS